MTWNHAFSLGFAVSGSHYEDDALTIQNEKDLVIGALLERVAQIIRDDELEEALNMAFDSYEEEVPDYVKYRDPIFEEGL